MARNKTAGANLPVPQNRDDAAAAVTTIGDVGRQLKRLEADMNDELAKTKEAYEYLATPLRASIEEKTEGLKIWAEANRTALTGGDKTKTVDIGTGVLRWRLRPPSVRLLKIESILTSLRGLGLQRFVRTKEEVDKEAMLREPEVARMVPGVTIGSEGEDFIVEPFETALSEAQA